jgi:PAS domain S-box-containing protein
VRLPPEAASVSAARRHVRDVLTLAGREDWADDAQLAVSELVTNVVLHARTECEVTVELGPGAVRVAVTDQSPAVPLERHFSDQSTTGRGLRLVARLGADFGVEPLDSGGKAVWFTVDGTAPAAEEGADAEWDLDGLDLLEEVAAVVVLTAVPRRLWLAALEHQAAVLRELFLVRAVRPDVVLGPVLAAADEALALLLSGTDTAVRAIRPLQSRPATVDVVVALPPVGAEVFDHFRDALDVGRELARDGHLLLRPPLPEITTLRDWACDQAVAQVKGVAPTPWDSNLLGPGAGLTWGVEAPRWDDDVVRSSAIPVVAADDTNRIIAVSPAAADLLGYGVEELVGERVTAIIPPRLREPFVAGFTRYLVTGKVTLLGRRLQLPARHRDGSEIERMWRFEAQATPDGRQVYLAWIEE